MIDEHGLKKISHVFFIKARSEAMRTISTDNKFRQNKAFLIRYRILNEKIERLKDKLAQIDEDMAALKSPKLTSEPKA
ncbi:hypothetical protein, partial [Campylobacter sp. 2018MI27]|uniref:hypothetical protein n=1 Tax=Campylobacter sp. 2018MI27 TaxID=2836738 RepID=UPI001BDAB64B